MHKLGGEVGIVYTVVTELVARMQEKDGGSVRFLAGPSVDGMMYNILLNSIEKFEMS